jgi:HAD superfamily hydrolase (TIGR01493 family)
MLKCIAFDCFGTVFDMKNILPVEIRAYVKHVKADDFRVFTFPDSWWSLKAHDDAARGIKQLQQAGFVCIAMSNGSKDLISTISLRNGIDWGHIVDLVSRGVYKPHVDAYRAIEKDTGFKPQECLMVTANPGFGDPIGAAAIGMPSQVIRNPECPRDIVDLAELLISQHLRQRNI